MTPVGGYFAILTADVLGTKKINDGTKLLYAVITSLCNKRGFCFASDQYFADRFSVSVSTIKDRVRALKKHKFIRVKLDKSEDGKRVVRRRIYPMIHIAGGVGQNLVGGGAESCPEGGAESCPVKSKGSEEERDNKVNSDKSSETERKTKREKSPAFTVEHPQNLNSDAWDKWLMYRKEIKKMYKAESTVKLLMNELAALPWDIQMQCVKDSIKRG